MTEILQNQNTHTTDTAPEKPEWLPEKFWKDGEIQMEQLVKSYKALEQKLSTGKKELDASEKSEKTLENTPCNTDETPSDLDAQGDISESDTPLPYDIEDVRIGRDAEFEHAMQAVGLNAEQASAMYALADTYFGTFLDQKTAMDAQLMQMELMHHFGGQDAWDTLQSELHQWATDNLPSDTVEHLCSSVQGVKALHKMMTAGAEPKLSGNDTPKGKITAEDLRKMMDDPRYWRERNPQFIAQVQKGFKSVYGD